MSSFRLLDRFRATFEGVRYLHRSSKLGDLIALELYEDLRPQKKGVAAVALIDGVCQGCHEQLSSVYVDRLKRVEGPKRCEHCRRILVI